MGPTAMNVIRSEAGMIAASATASHEGRSVSPAERSRLRVKSMGLGEGLRRGEVPQQRTASEAGFTPAERAGGLGGATQPPPAQELIGSLHRSISPNTTSSDPISAMMSAMYMPLASTWKMLMAVKQGLL